MWTDLLWTRSGGCWWTVVLRLPPCLRVLCRDGFSIGVTCMVAVVCEVGGGGGGGGRSGEVGGRRGGLVN